MKKRTLIWFWISIFSSKATQSLDISGDWNSVLELIRSSTVSILCKTRRTNKCETKRKRKQRKKGRRQTRMIFLKAGSSMFMSSMGSRRGGANEKRVSTSDKLFWTLRRESADLSSLGINTLTELSDSIKFNNTGTTFLNQKRRGDQEQDQQGKGERMRDGKEPGFRSSGPWQEELERVGFFLQNQHQR